LDALPLTPSGKVDRGALPEEAGERARGARRYAPPRDPREERIAHLWAEVLGVERVGIEDDFFALGGHSLLAIRLVTRLREELGIELPLSRLFARPTVAGAAAAGRDGTLSPAPATVISPDPSREGEPFPLTPVQQAYWIGRRPELELGGVGSHEYFEVDVADLEIGRLGAAWRRLVERHGMLRAVTDADGRQRILPRVEPYEVRVFDLRGLRGEGLEEALRAVRHDLSHQLFDTGRWPLFAVCASLLPGGGSRLHLSLDLIVCDARSLQVLARELVHLYGDPGAVLLPLSLSFRDYTLAAAGQEEGEDVRRSREYWKARAATLPPPPQLPLAGGPARLSSPRFSRHGSTLAAASWRRLQERARRERLSSPAVLLAVFSEVIAQWSRRRRFTLNLPVANRLPLHPEVMDIVGDFTTLCLLEVDFTAGEPFAVRARKLQDRLWEDLDHRHVHGIEVMREMGRIQGRSGEGMPVVFTSTLGLEGEDASGVLARLGDVAFRLTQTPQVWLDLLVSELEDGLHLDWDAVDALFPTGLVDDMAAAQIRLLEALAEGEEAWAAPVWPLLPEMQRRRREEVNATAAPFPSTTLHALFVERAERHPERLAVVAGEERLTYGELLRRSRHLCGQLREAGVLNGALVAVVMEKGWEQAVAVLATLGAGAAYLPLDPELPAERLHTLLAEGGARLVLTQPALDGRLSWPAGLRRIAIEIEAGDAGPLAPGDPDDLAYVMFTSGSTGIPKGVIVRHRGLVNA
ncbi:MAG TPA: AMP-binding protein, partial [Thermoanaerobaculia bacterium]|nr:AMP-binding protein [Thermoanaerobaculia bacterium]